MLAGLLYSFARPGHTKAMSTPTSSHAPESCRLNKFLAQAGVCSRRKADTYIAAGRVQVNGSLVTQLGVQVHPGQDEVRVDGRVVELPESQSAGHDYILLHKPVQVVTTAKDPQGRRTVLDLLPSQTFTRRIFPVGRLDFMSEGLLLLTSDGELANRLTHPRWHVEKVYEVTLREAVTEEHIKQMSSGMRLSEGEQLAPVNVQRRKTTADTSSLELTLHQGVNRQIRRMCRDLGLTILRLKRIRQGPVRLGKLPQGHWRHLTATEITTLKKRLGL